MDAILLAGGFGVRLAQERPELKGIPKQLIPLGNKKVIDYSIEQIAPHVEKIGIVVNALFADQFVEWAKTSPFSEQIIIFNNGVTSSENRNGSIGDLIFARDKMGKNDTLVVGGDNLFPSLSIKDMLALDKTAIAVYDVKDLQIASKYGIVALDGNVITSFEEKPENPKSTLASTLVYKLPKDVMESLDDYKSEREGIPDGLDKAGDFIAWLVEKGTVLGYVFDGSWFDIGSGESLDAAAEYYTK